MSRHTSSGDYDDDRPTELDAWQALTAPIIAMGPHNLRAEDMGWVSVQATEGTDVTMNVVVPSHPIFAGITLAANQIDITVPLATTTDFTPVDYAAGPGNGLLLATVVGGLIAGSPYIVYFDGTQPYFAGETEPGNAARTPASPRLIFYAGGGISDGDWDFTTDGATMFINAVNWMTSGGGAEGAAEGTPEPEGLPEPFITEGAPVAGALGLGLIAAMCALGGTLFIRKK
jgi:hypothetical protein